jgi:hypothetical protein
MKKTPNSPDTIQVTLTLTSQHVDMLDLFIVRCGAMSRSDAARQLLASAFLKRFPDYIFRLTPAGQIKAAKTEEQAALDSMTDEQYVLSPDVQGKILTDRLGVRMVVLHSLGNSVKVVPLDGAKALLTDQDIFLKDHRDGIASHGSVEGSFTTYTKSIMLSEYQIDLDHQPAPDAAAEEKI